MPVFFFGDLRRYPAGHPKAPARYGHGDTWRVEAPNLKRAITAFRVACLYPHTYSTTRIGPAVQVDGWNVYQASGPGAEVHVYGLHEAYLATIPVEDPTRGYIPGVVAMIPGAVEAVVHPSRPSRDSGRGRGLQDT